MATHLVGRRAQTGPTSSPKAHDGSLDTSGLFPCWGKQQYSEHSVSSQGRGGGKAVLSVGALRARQKDTEPPSYWAGLPQCPWAEHVPHIRARTSQNGQGRQVVCLP